MIRHFKQPKFERTWLNEAHLQHLARRVASQFLAVGVAWFLSASAGLASPDRLNYQVQFDGSPPLDGAHALSSFDARGKTVIQFLACGEEAYFLDGSTHGDREGADHKIRYADAEEVSEAMLHEVLAKIFVYSTWPKFATKTPSGVRCEQQVHYFVLKPKKSASDRDVPDIDALEKLNFDDIESRIVTLFGERCEGTVKSHNIDFRTGLVSVGYSLTRECLSAQINKYLAFAYVNGQAGSTGAPCFPIPIGQSVGEWDVNLKELTRIYFANDRAGDNAPLDEDVRTHIRNDLLTLDGAPGKESYNLGECGNQEYDTGPPEDRADDQNWTRGALDDIGDALGWLAKWLARLLTLALALAIALTLVGALIGLGMAIGVIASLAALGVAAITFGDFPESENHLLMMESSRYLNNQIILKEIDPANENRNYFVDEQASVRDWVLKRLQRIAAEDFIEYNARPYQRYSISAIRNLADFAQDEQIRLAARNVLDLASAKFAVGSSQGRRLVPFRRLMEVVQTHVEPDGHDKESGNLLYNGYFDQEGGADHQIAAMLAYAGQTQQTPGRELTPQSADEMLLAVASDYRPPEPVLDLAINKRGVDGQITTDAEIPYNQAFKHDGAEIYSGTAGFVLTAGGIQSPMAYTMELRGLSVGGSLLGIIPLGFNKERGAGVPTTLMLAGGTDRSSMEAFLRINGPRRSFDSDNATYDDNLCVYRGFACGLNVIDSGRYGGQLPTRSAWYSQPMAVL